MENPNMIEEEEEEEEEEEGGDDDEDDLAKRTPNEKIKTITKVPEEGTNQTPSKMANDLTQSTSEVHQSTPISEPTTTAPTTTTTTAMATINDTAGGDGNSKRQGSKKSISRQPSLIQLTATKIHSISNRIKVNNQLASAKRFDTISITGGVLSEQPHPIVQMPDILLSPINSLNESGVGLPGSHQRFNNLNNVTSGGYNGSEGNPFADTFNQSNDSINMEGIVCGGNLIFDNDFKAKSVTRPYLHVMHDVQVRNVAQMMVTKWDLPIPRIVLFMLTNIGDLRSWSNARQVAAFQKGLMKAANTTSMWIVTNGLDVGLSKLIGDAVEKETKEMNTYRYFEKNRQSFNLIGISNESNLSYNQQFFGKEIQLGNPGPIVNENRFELNQQHTHFVIMKESQSNEDHTSTLLTNFIDYLTKRCERSPKKPTTAAMNDNDDLEEDDGPLFNSDNNYSNYTTLETYYDTDPLYRPGGTAGNQMAPNWQFYPRPSGGADNAIGENQNDQPDTNVSNEGLISKNPRPMEHTLEDDGISESNYFDTLSFVSKEGKVDTQFLPPELGEGNRKTSIKGNKKDDFCHNDCKGKTKFYLGTTPEPEPPADPACNSPGRNSLSILNTSIIPVVCLVIKGGYNCARLVVDNLKRHNPVIVFRGSGGFADLLSYAYLEMQQRCRDLYTSWDAEFVENTLKPLLTSKIVKRFPNLRNNALTRDIFRDRIIECVRRSGSPKGRVYLSVLNMHNSSCNLENLSEFILLSLFKSQNRKDTLDANLLRKDLYLTLDWNCSHVALDEVLRRNPSYNLQLEKLIFELALVRENREDFVDLFLSHGFKIHKYLTPFRLKKLITYSLETQEFFRTVCMENIIGIAVWSVNFEEMLDRLANDSDSFIKTELNQLIFTSTHLKEFINVDHLYLNIMGLYPEDEESAERKCVAILAMWAVFNKRFKLAETLWKHSDQPIHLGLIISMMLERLAWFVSEHYLKDDLQSHAKIFAQFAIGVLDACYQQDERRAYELLSQENSDWDRKTAVDIAANGSHRAFIAHPCCQKWLTNTFNGRIRIRELTWGLLTVPPVLKVILSAFLIFPMYIWIRFLDENGSTTWHVKGKKGTIDRDEFEDSEGEEDRFLKQEAENFRLIHLKKKENLESGERLVETGVTDTLAKLRGNGGNKKDYYFYRQRRFFLRKQPPLWTMIYQLWSAPITKFWTYQVFYIFYLGFLSLAVIWPGCGNWWLDLVVCSWTVLSLVEQIQRTFRLYRKYTSVPMLFRMIEIIWLIVFVLIYTFGRVFTWNHHSFGYAITPYTMKITLCLGLLYFYYRLFAIHLTISPTLGPLLYRFKLMVTVDFIHFMRMALILLFSSGIVIQAVLYPNTELSIETFHKAFHRTAISLFLTPVDELIEKCNRTEHFTRPIMNKTATMATTPFRILLNDTTQKMNVFRSFIDTLPHFGEWTCPTHPVPMAQSCPQTGFWPYFFSFQFLIFLKLILLTLLYALFANTASRLQSETDNIWKFQRYLLVIDFANRPALHAPFSAFAYLWRIIVWIIRIATCNGFKLCLRWWAKKRDQTDHHNKAFISGPDLGPEESKSLTQEDYNFWRYLAKKIYETTRKTKGEDELTRMKQGEMLQLVVEEVEHSKHTVRTLKTKMAELEHLLYQASISLESIKHSTLVGSAGKVSDVGLVGGALVGMGTDSLTTALAGMQSPIGGGHKTPGQSAPHHQQHYPMASFSGHVHLLSRHSPYVGTQIQRFPIADKFVSWDVIWINYDPVTFSRKREDSPLVFQPYVDEDILAIKGRMLRAGTPDGQMHLPVFNWNAVSMNPAGLTIDRKSWLLKGGGGVALDFDNDQDPKTLVYKLDDGIPLNPFGRTGLRGKGNLPRWGPNHYVMLIVTRSRQLFGTALLLQFALEHRSGHLALPMRFIGDESLFAELSTLFTPLETENGGRVSWTDKDSMFEYFKRKCSPSKIFATTAADGAMATRMLWGVDKSASTSFVSRPSPTPSLGAMSASGSIATEQDETAAVRFDADYVQYIDSPDNTDNAWKEVRVFHVHFHSTSPSEVTDNIFTNIGSSTMIWMGATEDLLIRLPMEQVPFMNCIIRRFETMMRP